MFWRDEFPLDQFSNKGTYVYLYHFNVKSSFALHDGFMVFATKNVSISSMSCFERCKSEFPRKIFTCIRELKYGITAWVYGNFIKLWCNQDWEVGTAKLTHIHEYLAAYPTRMKLFLQHINVHLPGTFIPLILYL